MGLGNLLFGKRKQYNGHVDFILKEKLQFDTNNNTNPHFPGILYYLRLIDYGWNNKCSAEETAVNVAVGLFMGMRDQQQFRTTEAMNDMQRRIVEFVQDNYRIGNIRKTSMDAAKKDLVGSAATKS
jgi:hypothetical protein